ncbi:MAG: beta-ketoacyl synthase N-terminal-like domain-containing protein [Planctomycetota bacterium]
MRQEPVAITGMGLVCRRVPGEPACVGTSGRTRFMTVECPVVPSRFEREMQRTAERSRAIELAMSAAIEAMKNAAQFDSRCGVVVTVSKGLTDAIEAAVERLISNSNHTLIPTISELGADAAAVWIARAMTLGGPASAVVAACASGVASIKLGMDWLRDGVCDSVLAGAAESSNSDLILRSFERMGVISPSGRTRPFDALRDGFVVGEGAGIFRIERMESARRSGSEILGTIAGIALGADAHHVTTPDPEGTVLAGVIENTMLRAGIEPGQIGWIHAHGTATAYNDPLEIRALQRVFGKQVPPVTATKGITGHLLGASGAVALGLTVEALRGGFIPGIAGLEEPAAEFEDIDLVLGAARVTTAKTALVLNHGFGGHIAAAVVTR